MDPRQYDSRYVPSNRDGGRHAQQNSGQTRDRSRSRGSVGRKDPPRQRPFKVKVKVNYFRLKFINDDQGEWIQYDVEIRDAMRTKKKNPDGTFVDPYEYELVPKLVKKKDDDGNEIKVERTVNLDRGGTSLSRRILLKLQRELLAENPQRSFVTDGEKQAYAPKRLFTKQLDPLQVGTEEVDANKGSGTRGGIYGPADTGAPHNRPQAPQTGPFEDYYVRVPKDCDDDVDGVKMAWYIVRLREVGKIVFHDVRQSMMPQVVEAGQTESMRQCLEIILKNQMMLTMECWGRSPRMFFFPDNVQDRIRGNKLMSRKPNEIIAPFVGMTQAVRFCTNGNTYVARDVGTRWFNLDNLDKRPISLLDTHLNTFAGVHIGSCREIIEDLGLRQSIQEALEKIIIDVKYKANLDKDAIERIRTYHKKLNKSDDMIARIIANRQEKAHRNQKLITDQTEAAIVWAADDENLYYFTRKNDPDGIKFTVYKYFKDHHGLTLRYPKMPIIWTKAGYCPAEFLFQAKSPVRGANSNEQSQRVLGFHDEFAGGDKIRHLTNTVDQLKGLCRMQEMNHDVLDTKKFNFEVDDKPVEVYATLLPEPSLVFGNNRQAEIKNGSWNLVVREGRGDVKFSRPADLPSFAVLDLAGDFVKILNRLLLRARSHGIATPPCGDFSEMIEKLQIKVTDQNPEKLSNAFHNAIKKAKTYFLSDTSGFFQKRNIMFKSLYVSPDGVTTECLVYPLEPVDELGVQQGLFGLICPPEKVYATHMLKYDDKKCEAARQVVTVSVGDERIDVDPFDFRWTEDGSNFGYNEAKIGRQWTRVTHVGYAWKLQCGRVVRDSSLVSECLSCQAFQVECPAVIFVNLPTDDKACYHFVKLLSNFACGGIPSQCIVRNTFRRQRSPEQYFSNIALKLNTKLANKFNDACAWEIEGQGLSWVTEVPTLIMGLSMSRGAGKDSLTAVAASALLSLKRGSQMRMAQILKIQSQPGIVEDHVMRAITKTLTIQFYKHTGTLPKRVLVFRDGSSEGNFQELVDHEFANVRKGIREVMEKLFNEGVDCAEWWCRDFPDCGTLCASCIPRLTFTVCVNDHNVRVVPDTPNGRNKNVESGTCIDSEIMPVKWSPAMPRDYPYEIQDQAQKDFLLTAHGGLKGTSKPVFYRVIVDENQISPPLMQSIVYEMSFQYGTATKAVRKVPVVLYSKRLAETAVGFLAYIIGQRPAEGVDALCQVVDINSAGQERSWVRREMEGDEDCDYAVRNELLPDFSPYETSFEDKSIWRTPFRTHLSS